MARIRSFSFIFIVLLTPFFTSCSENDGNGTPMLSGESNRVSLISQAAIPEHDADYDNKGDSLLGARKWSYSVEWRVNSYSSISDIITFQKIENGGSSVLGSFSVFYVSSMGIHSVILLRKSGTLAMEDLSLSIIDSSLPVDLNLVGSGANHLIYEFYSENINPSDLVHHLTITKLDIMKTDEINFIYEVQKGYHVGFASPLMASIIENEPLKLGSNENNQKTLEQHLTDFFTDLFSDEDKAHFFKLSVSAVYKINNNSDTPPPIFTTLPVILIPSVSSSDLDTFVPSLSSAINEYLAQTGGNLYCLQFSVDVFGGNEAEIARLPILRLSDVLLEKNLVSDFN